MQKTLERHTVCLSIVQRTEHTDIWHLALLFSLEAFSPAVGCEGA